jgi:hypothetical protein
MPDFSPDVYKVQEKCRDNKQGAVRDEKLKIIYGIFEEIFLREKERIDVFVEPEGIEMKGVSLIHEGCPEAEFLKGAGLEDRGRQSRGDFVGVEEDVPIEVKDGHTEIKLV